MSTSLTRKIFFGGLLIEALAILAIILIHSVTPIAVTFILLAVVAQLIVWVGAIIKTAEAKQWGWFLGLLVGGLIAMLVYVFVGPEIQRKSIV